MENKNYYDVLEVSSKATIQEIHTAFEKAKNSYSDDSMAMYSLLTPDECRVILGEIEQAYSIISIPEKRLAYDKVKGLNQDHTQEGFIESLNESLSRPKDISKTIELKPIENKQQINPEHEKTQEFTYNQSEKKVDVAIARVQVLKKFGLDFEVNNAFEQEIEACEEFTGAFLQKVREYKDVTIERMAEMTKISKTYIRHIEADSYEKLPAIVFTRGFVYQYAKCLKLNPEVTAASYIRLVKESKENNA